MPPRREVSPPVRACALGLGDSDTATTTRTPDSQDTGKEEEKEYQDKLMPDAEGHIEAPLVLLRSDVFSVALEVFVSLSFSKT